MLVWAVHNGGFDDGHLVLGRAAAAGHAHRRGRAASRGARRSRAPAVIALGASRLRRLVVPVDAVGAVPGAGARRQQPRAALPARVRAVDDPPVDAARPRCSHCSRSRVGVGRRSRSCCCCGWRPATSSARCSSRVGSPRRPATSTRRVALFTIDALLATSLAGAARAARRRCGACCSRPPAPACSSRSSARAAAGCSRSRSSLLVAIALSRDRLRVAAAAVIPIARRARSRSTGCSHVFNAPTPARRSTHAAESAGTAGADRCASAAFVARHRWSRWPDRLTAGRVDAARAGAGCSGAVAVAVAAARRASPAASPPPTVTRCGSSKRQWNGFSHQRDVGGSSSHFADVGSGRYDFWRVALDAFVAHPIGGLGQDNFADYYLPIAARAEEPAGPHSLELRLLAHTGIVGFALFAASSSPRSRLRLRARRRGRHRPASCAAAPCCPCVVWLIHGSVDWFWEMPALSGPALGFLGVARRARAAVAPVAERTSVAAAAAPAAGRRVAAVRWAPASSLLVCAHGRARLPVPLGRARSRRPACGASDPERSAERSARWRRQLDPLQLRSRPPGRHDRAAHRAATRRPSDASGRRSPASPAAGTRGSGAGLAASALGDRVAGPPRPDRRDSIDDRQPAVARRR